MRETPVPSFIPQPTRHRPPGRPRPSAGNSTAWLERSLRAVWHPCTQMKQHETLPLVAIARGDGAWLYDFDGRRYLDAVSSWWVNLFGHANPRIGAAIAAQLGELEHVMLAGFTHRPVVELSERLAALAPGEPRPRVLRLRRRRRRPRSRSRWRSTTGRTAAEPEKTAYLSLAGAYHGETLGALAVTDVPIFRDVYAPLLNRNMTVPSPDARRAAPGESPRDVAERAAAALERAPRPRITRRSPRSSSSRWCRAPTGMAMHDPHYLARARELCTRHRRAADRGRDHDGLRPHRNDVRLRSRPGSRRT